MLTPWQDPLATAAPTPSSGWEPGPGGGELWRRLTAWYARLRALPRRMRRALQRQLALPLMGVALLLALSQGFSQAGTIVVDGVTCTLGDAINAANTDTAQGGCPAGSGADTLVLEPPGGMVTLTRVDNTTRGGRCCSVWITHERRRRRALAGLWLGWAMATAMASRRSPSAFARRWPSRAWMDSPSPAPCPGHARD